MKNRQSLNTFLLATLIVTAFACERDVKSSGTPSKPASVHIAQSEKLTIPETVALPANLPKGNIRIATYYAEGFQKYKAVPKVGDPTKFDWAFVAPEANLYDISDLKVGTHGAGPFWQVSASDSIFGQHFTPVKSAPSPEANTIDWLLLKPKTGTVPTGIFSQVEYIQRIATKGGKAPAVAPVSGTDTVSVWYEAVYRFSKKVL